MSREYGNGIEHHGADRNKLLAVLHQDARRTLPAGAPYEIREYPEPDINGIRRIAWYSSSDLTDWSAPPDTGSMLVTRFTVQP